MSEKDKQTENIELVLIALVASVEATRNIRGCSSLEEGYMVDFQTEADPESHFIMLYDLERANVKVWGVECSLPKEVLEYLTELFRQADGFHYPPAEGTPGGCHCFTGLPQEVLVGIAI